MSVNVHFVDTSILANIFDIDNYNDKKDEVISELSTLYNSNNIFIITFPSVVNIKNLIKGNCPESRAETVMFKFGEFLRRVANDEIPFKFYQIHLYENDLTNFGEISAQELSFDNADLTILDSYNNFKTNIPFEGNIRIWSLNETLSQYNEFVSL